MSNDLEKHEPKTDVFERMERFQSLQAGAYWRALEAFPKEGIDQDEVLLVESIRWADDAPHTVVVRAHPDKFGRRYPVTEPRPDGGTTTYHRDHGTHRFLVDDFLVGFEFEPDHERIRADEIQRVQGRIADLQTELIAAQSDPTIISAVVDKELAKRDMSKQEKGEAPPSLPAIPVEPSHLLQGATLNDVMRVGLTEGQVEGMRKVAERQHEIATIKAEWIRGKTMQIGETVKRMTPYFEEQAAAALARTEDVRAHVDRLKSGIETLDLYVGKGVTVETLVEGESAAPDEPLSLIQRKLMVEEELALWCDVEEWFDFTNDDKFVKALRENPGLIDQIFPAKRAVVAMATLRRGRDYGDPWTNAMKNTVNREVFLLVRDGERVHRIFSSVESHLGSHRLFPSRTELDRIFTGFDGRAVGLEDVAYTDRLTHYQAAELHYKRFLVLLCGLDHRLDLFGKFYDGDKDMSFMSTEFQERHMRFVYDDEGSTAIEGDRRVKLRDWIKDKNRYLVAGSRVMCDWYQLINPDTAPSAAVSTRRDTGSGMELRYSPARSMGVVVASKRKDELIVDIEVSGENWRTMKDREFTCHVSLTAYREGYYGRSNRLPYLCLDAVSPSELEWYINDRRSRHDHLEYMRFFKTALKHLEAERAAEEDARERMRQALVDGAIATEAEHADIVDRTIMAWRAANRGKPFPTFDGERAPREWKAILDQMGSLAGMGRERIVRIAEHMKALGQQPLRISVSGKSRLVAYAAPAVHERDDRVQPHAWVHRVELDVELGSVVEVSRRWVSMPEIVASETVLEEWDAAAEWIAATSSFSSTEHKSASIALVEGWKDRVGLWVGPEADLRAAFDRWRSVRDELHKTSKLLCHPQLQIPIGFVVHRNRVSLVSLQCHAPEAIIHAAGDEQLRVDLRRSYIRPFSDKSNGLWQLRLATMGAPAWNIVTDRLPEQAAANRWSDILDEGAEKIITPDHGKFPLLAGRFATYAASHKDEAFWFAPAGGAFEELELDDVLGIVVPDDQVDLMVCKITISRPDKEGKISWVDIVPEAMAKGEEGKRFAWMPEEKFEGCGSSYSSRPARSWEHARILAERSLDRGERFVDEAVVKNTYPTPEGVERRWFTDK